MLRRIPHSESRSFNSGFKRRSSRVQETSLTQAKISSRRSRIATQIQLNRLWRLARVFHGIPKGREVPVTKTLRLEDAEVSGKFVETHVF